MVAVTERIGIVLVHGIGEQRRFEHLEGQGRLLVDALRRRPGAEVSVDILAAKGGASYRSEQNTWGASPSVRIAVKEDETYREFFLHEVWWADVNEPYSVAKQLRFWLWGLSVWMYPRKDFSTSAGFAAMTDPVIPRFHWFRKIIVRLQLFGVSLMFLMAAFPLGLIVVLAKRLFNFQAPDFVQTIVNYVSGVKLYNQRRRYGAQLFFNKESDFLDTMEEPPRVSVRRRMIEIMTDMALQDQPYKRWYVLAHSLGSVVAFNGLMEPGEMLANYLGKERWNDLVAKGFAGKRANLPARSPYYFDSRSPPPPPPGGVPPRVTAPVPARPLWLEADDVVYRHLLFKNFEGVLTYGSPLEKFAAIWPARVPINKLEPHFPSESEWINVYDPVDPVSGVLGAFSHNAVPDRCTPRLLNIGFSAHRLLLYAHLRYMNLTSETAEDLGDAVAQWIVERRAFRVPTPPRPRWFKPFDIRHLWRKCLSAVEYFVAFVLIGWLGAWFVNYTIDHLIPQKAVDWAVWAWGWLDFLTLGLANAVVAPLVATLVAILVAGRELLDVFVPTRLAPTVHFIVACALITLAVGIFASVFFFKRDPDDIANLAPEMEGKSKFVPDAHKFGMPGKEVTNKTAYVRRAWISIKGWWT